MKLTRSLPTPISEFLTVFSPAIVLTILLGAVGEAIVARVVVEYFLYIARMIAPFPIPDWAVAVVRFIGLLAVIAMAWRVIPPPKGVSQSIYSVASAMMYVAFWLVQPLNVAVVDIGRWLHGLAISIARLMLGKEAFTSLLLGIASSIFQTFIATITAQFIPIATVIFLALLIMCYMVLYYFMAGVVMGVVSKVATFLRTYLQHHPAWYLLITMIVADMCTGLLMTISIVILSMIIGAVIAMIVAVVVSKTPWSFLSEIASGFVGVIVAIFLSTIMRTILDNTGRFIEDLFNIRPPMSALIFGVLLATAGAIAIAVTLPLLYAVTGLYVISSALTVLGILGGGVPKKARQMRTFITALTTMFMLATIAGPLLEPVRRLLEWVITTLRHFGLVR